MSFLQTIERVRAFLERQQRVSLRALRREFDLDTEALDELVEELVDVQRVARREDNVLVWSPPPPPNPVVPTAAPGVADRAEAPRADARRAEVRKVVTIIFADLIGSTALHERLDPESVSRLMERYYGAMRAAVDAHGGTVVKLMGDGVMAAFGVQRVGEDDAIRAVRAGVAMQDAFRELARREPTASLPAVASGGEPAGVVGLRVGINTGEVVVSADHADVVGDPVNVAARLQAEAHDGEVVIGESTRRLVAARVTLAALGSFALKGRAEAMKAYRVESLDPAVATSTAELVGRDDELARLLAVCDAAVARPAARLAVLLGSPGLGKSRLIEEVTGRLGGAASVVTASCDAAGGATFAPVAAALRKFFHLEAGASPSAVQATIAAAITVTDAERGRIAGGIAALLAESPASPEETFFVIRRLLAALAAARPVVLAIDDLHWAEPLLLDLVEHLVQWGSGTPLAVLVGARPELRDLRSSLVTPGGLVSEVVTLTGLDAGAAMRLAANVIGAADLPAAVAAKVLATSEGNPLFVRELVRMLVDEGAIERQGERWIVGANLAALEMPPTIHALLAARIERLAPAERTVLERAAVVGRHFSRSAVAALLSRNGSGSLAGASGEGPELDARLEALRRTELIERDSGWFLGEPVLRFHHVLIRDAAYRRLLKGTRAELHEHLADWIEAQVLDAPEHDETIGWHLEQAHQHRRELGLSGGGSGSHVGPLDAQGTALGARAARRLAAAGRRALERDDVPLAASLLGRAIDCLDRDDPARADLALDWCEALLAAGDVIAARNAIDELARVVPDPSGLTTNSLTTNNLSARLRAWHTCFTGQLTVLTAPQALHETATAVAAAAEALASLDDAAGEAKAHFVHALALARLGRVGGCEAALDRALAAARRAGDRRRANTVLAIAPLAALWGPSPVTRASGRCLDVVRVLRITQGAPAVEAVALSCQAVLEALRGRSEAARRMLAAARKMVEDLGITHRLLEADVFGGLIDLLEGDATGAERSLRRACDGLRDLGLGIDAARAAALLARALLAQDRIAEAEALSHESEALAGDDLKAAIAWRGVRAEALARRGEHAAATELAQAAVAIAAATDALLDHADARLALAAALRAAGRGRDADAEARRAIELWEAKGATLLIERTCRANAAVAAPAPVAPPGRAPASGRRIIPSRASEALVAFNAAMAAPDFAAFREQLSETYEEIDHPTGVSYGRDANVAALQRLMRSRDASCQLEPLATLGDRLVLSRRRVHASATGGGRFDVGEYEQEAFSVAELDTLGRWCRHEVFAADHLGAAVARLYGRHAELLPEGPERAHAAAIAAGFAVIQRADADRERLAPALAPDFESVDHRHLSSWSLRGADAYLAHLRALRDVADDVDFRQLDLIALSPGAQLVRVLHTGTDRAGGGTYERPFLRLFVADADGRIARAEWFDDDREAEALARFDELAAGKAPPRAVRCRVTPNAATGNVQRFGAAAAAHDLDALADLLCEDVEAVHHGTGLTYGRKGFLTTWRSMFRAEKMTRRQEIIASLGDALALGHHTIWIEGLSEAHLAAVGPVEVSEVVIFEVDERGRARRVDMFPVEKLGDALVRLYERHAELLPEGPERERAAATARTVAVWNGSIDVDRVAATTAPSMECVDHRSLNLWTARGAEEFFAQWRGQLDLATGSVRYDDVLAAAPHALLVHQTFFGTDRATEGFFDHPLIALIAFGADGLLTRVELWEADRDAEALARFAALRARPGEADGGGTDSVADWVENAAARADRELFERFNARDWTGVETLAAPELVFDERRRMLHNTCGRDVWLEQFRVLYDVPASRFSTTLLGTCGERLSLSLHRFAGEVPGGGGPVEMDDHLVVHEVDGEGRFVAIVLFDLDDEDAAWSEIYARFRAGEGAPLDPGQFPLFEQAVNARDWAAAGATLGPTFVAHDHRRITGIGTTRGREAWLQNNLRGWFEIAPDLTFRFRHTRWCERGNLWQLSLEDTREDGRFEIAFLGVTELDAQGLAQRIDIYDLDRIDDARARFAELARGGDAPARFAEVTPVVAVPERFANAATMALKRLYPSFAAQDWDAVRAACSSRFTWQDRRPIVGMSGDVELMIASARERMALGGRHERREIIGTAGERVAISRILWAGGPAGGRFEVEFFAVHEIDADGLWSAMLFFEPDDLRAAQREAWARWAAIDPTVAEMTTNLGAVVDAWNAKDLERLRALFAEDLVAEDHRLTGIGRSAGREAYLRSVAALWELAPDSRLEAGLVWLAHAPHAGLHFCRRTGMLPGGGEFASDFLVLVVVERGLATRLEIFETDAADAALARFDELRAAARRGGSRSL